MPIHVVLVFAKCENNPSYNRESSRHFTLTSANQRGEFSVCGTERGRFPGVKRNESFLKGHFHGEREQTKAAISGHGPRCGHSWGPSVADDVARRKQVVGWKAESKGRVGAGNSRVRDDHARGTHPRLCQRSTHARTPAGGVTWAETAPLPTLVQPTREWGTPPRTRCRPHSTTAHPHVRRVVQSSRNYCVSPGILQRPEIDVTWSPSEPAGLNHGRRTEVHPPTPVCDNGLRVVL